MRWGALIVIAAAACSSSPHRPPGPIAGAPPPPPPGPRHDLAVGGTHACARTKDGRVWCFAWWTFVGGIAPVEIADAKDATAIAVGRLQARAGPVVVTGVTL